MNTVLIVDDHSLFAEGLLVLLKNERTIDKIEVYTNPEVLLTNFEKYAGDTVIVLLDIRFEKRIINGIDICLELKQKNPSAKVIALSMHSENHYVQEMLKAGADGYLLKNASRSEITTCIDSVLDNQLYLAPSIMAMMKQNTKSEAAHADLNPREKKILEKVIEGYTSKQIADYFGISIKTVEYYRNSLFIKFEAKNIVELIKNTSDLL